MPNCENDCSNQNDQHGHGNRHPHIVTLTSGTTTIGDQSTVNTDIIFAGTSATDMPTLQFVGSGDVTNMYSVRSITVAGDPWAGGTPASGSVALGFQASLEITNGVQVTDGQLNVMQFYGTDVILDGNSIIDDGGTLDSGGIRQQSPGTMVNGTITLGANGANQFVTAGGELSGNGTIRQLGASDSTFVSTVGSGVHLDIRSGTLGIGGATSFVDGTIGPIKGHGPSLGPSATIEFFGYGLPPGDTTTATFDTSTGLLSLIDSRGWVVSDFHFSGNARGLNVSIVPDSGFNAGYVSITDHPGTVSPIPIIFS